MKDAFNGSSPDDNADGGSFKERPAEPANPELDQKHRTLSMCVAQHYEEFMSAARSWLGYTMRRHLGAKEFERRARSVVHSAYQRACKPEKLAKFNLERGDPRKWIFGFMRNIVRESKTRRAREHKHQENPKRATLTPISRLAPTDQQHLPQDDQFSLQTRFDGAVDDHMCPEMQAAQAKGDVERLLRLLPERDAILLKQKDIDGMTYEEIAAETGDKPEALRKRAERARKKLRTRGGNSTP